jgi:galactose mutarotase-like enzyme
MSKDQHTIVGDGVTATVLAHGAELCSLKTAAGLELIWQAGDVWPRHAPLLFPIVGKLKNDTLRHDGKSYPMTQHGFARDSRFEWVECGRSLCRLVLEDNAQTRARYPFAFRLAVTYALEGSDLDVSLEISNPGEAMLPVSIGGHPAFNWPLKPGLSKTSYRLVFAREEPASIRRLKDGLLRLQPEPSPIRNRELVLSETRGRCCHSRQIGQQVTDFYRRRGAVP